LKKRLYAGNVGPANFSNTNKLTVIVVVATNVVVAAMGIVIQTPAAPSTYTITLAKDVKDATINGFIR
jgi:hypothetical protein